MKIFLKALLISVICLQGLTVTEAYSPTNRQQQTMTKRPMTSGQQREADSIRKIIQLKKMINRDLNSGTTINNLTERGGSSRALAEAYKSIKAQLKEVKFKAPKDVTPEELYEILCTPLNREYRQQYEKDLNEYLNSLTTSEKSDLYTTAYLDWERKDNKASRSKAQFQKVVGKYIKNSAATSDEYYRRDYRQVRREVEQAKGSPLTQQESSALNSSYSSAQRDMNAEYKARGPVNVLRKKFERCPGCTKIKAGSAGSSSTGGAEAQSDSEGAQQM